VVSRVARQQLVDQVTRVSRSPANARELQRQVLDALRRELEFDAYVWVLTDPVTCVGAAPLADVPCQAELPRLIRLKYLTTQNRWTSLQRGEVALLVHATSGELSRSLLWREMLTAYEVRDIASTVFRDRFGCWAFLDLWRFGDGRQPFSAADAQLLGSITGVVTTGLRRAQAATFTRQPDRQRSTGAVVLLLSPTLEVRAQTPQTHDYLAALLPPTADAPPIPAIAYNAAAQMLAVEAGVDGHPAVTRVHLPGGQWLTLRAARLGGQTSPKDRDVAVTIEETSPADRLALFGAAFGLTEREMEVLQHLASGQDTREIAATLFVSENTVHDHVKAMLAKTALPTRRALLSVALAAPSFG
jgi:DNA-binding CsgD family transcriptional regulator